MFTCLPSALHRGDPVGLLQLDDVIERLREEIVENKFLKEITLVNQVFVKDEKQTIDQLLKNNNSTINGFKFFIVGEGIEKKEVDFASEVAAAQQ